MPNYILAYDGGRNANPEEGAKGKEKFRDWLIGLGDAVVNPGTPLGMFKTVSSSGVTESSSANPLTGFSIVKADTMEAALDMARTCPFLEMGTVDVAEVKEMQ